VTETVYVPQQVTRTVPRTIMTQQTRFRDVAVQTTQPMFSPFAPAAPAVGCNSCGDNHLGFTPTAVPPYPGVLPTAAPTSVVPSATTIPSMPAISVSPYSTPTPVPEYDDVGWSNVRPRTAPTPSRSHAPVRGASMFRPAPSAATVWQSRF
jgi:hypothetical protein